MTNDTRPPVAPKEGFYAMLRNGHVILYAPRPRGQGNEADAVHDAEGRAWCGSEGDEYARPAFDIIATISPEAMAWAAHPVQEVVCHTDRFARLEALIPLADAACDYADANCRAFPIATAPRDGTEIMIWDQDVEEWYKAGWSTIDNRFMIYYHSDSHSKKVNLTHWRPLPPPPSTPPLPEVFTQLGQALEKIKGAG